MDPVAFVICLSPPPPPPPPAARKSWFLEASVRQKWPDMALTLGTHGRGRSQQFWWWTWVRDSGPSRFLGMFSWAPVEQSSALEGRAQVFLASNQKGPGSSLGSVGALGSKMVDGSATPLHLPPPVVLLQLQTRGSAWTGFGARSIHPNPAPH